MKPNEIRVLEATELRAMGGSGDADPLRIEGYAAIFNRNANLPKFRERILPGAFTRAISQSQDVVCLFNHGADHVLGRTTSGTLRLRQDDKGLFYTCDLPNTQFARDLHQSISRRDINGCSFAFKIPDGGEDWSEQRDEDGTYYIQRDISDVNLVDVSPVTHPAYGGTNVVARSEEPPAELRSSVDLKNAALVTPPAGLEVPPVEKRSEELSFQEVIGGINAALAEKFGNAPNSNWQKWSVCEVYGSAKYAIVSNYDCCAPGPDNCEFGKVTFDVAEDGTISLGDLTPIELVKEFVVSDDLRSRMTTEIERRKAATPVEKRDEEDFDWKDEDDYDEEHCAEAMTRLEASSLSDEKKAGYREKINAKMEACRTRQRPITAEERKAFADKLHAAFTGVALPVSL